jgi:hypothetical protein
MGVFIGISHLNEEKIADNEWFFNLSNGEIGDPNEKIVEFTKEKVNEGDVVSLFLKHDEVHFSLNSKALGMAYKDPIFLEPSNYPCILFAKGEHRIQLL